MPALSSCIRPFKNRKYPTVRRCTRQGGEERGGLGGFKYIQGLKKGTMMGMYHVSIFRYIYYSDFHTYTIQNSDDGFKDFSLNNILHDDPQ